MTTINEDELNRLVDEVVSNFTSKGPQQAIITAAQANTELDTTIAIGSDHGGVDLKKFLVQELKNSDYSVIDVGTNTSDSVDYPDIAFAVAQKVISGSASFGIVIDGAGIGSCMAANKLKGIRAAMCYDHATAHNSREHNNANILTLGAGLIGPNLARQIVHTFLTTAFAGGRHARRVNKIIELEEK